MSRSSFKQCTLCAKQSGGVDDAVAAPVVREGVLNKKGKSFPYNSSARRFVLTDECLERFDPKTNQSKGKLLFTADRRHCFVRKEAKPAHSFTVVCGEEEHLLQAASVIEREEWVTDIRCCLQRLQARVLVLGPAGPSTADEDTIEGIADNIVQPILYNLRDKTLTIGGKTIKKGDQVKGAAYVLNNEDKPEKKFFDATFHECGLNRGISDSQYRIKSIIFNYTSSPPPLVRLMDDVKLFCEINGFIS
jgi:hypothetical protein